MIPAAPPPVAPVAIPWYECARCVRVSGASLAVRDGCPAHGGARAAGVKKTLGIETCRPKA